MTAKETRFAPFRARMTEAGMPELAIRSFHRHYEALRSGATGQIPEEEIAPADDLPEESALPAHLAELGQGALDRVVVIKLNGGLGTSMGLVGPKSLLVVREGRTFLDIMVEACRAKGVPLLLMNSFATRADTLDALDALPPLPGAERGLPSDLLQHQVPKVDAATLGPATWETLQELEWCPPGHGDLYGALVSSGVLEALLEAGIHYAFVSNADNLGALLSESILGYVVEQKIPFLMEVTRRYPADRKGGHLARRRRDGQLILRERAQCPVQDLPAFEDVTRYGSFNTNNLWIHLPSLRRLLAKSDDLLALPLIVNRKQLDPRDPSSPEVLQLETAMGAAISLIPGAVALVVGRDRFAPVKSTADLLAVRSDAYQLTSEESITLNPRRPSELPPLEVRLDPSYFQMVDQLDARFPWGSPSLLRCVGLEVVGDVRFGRNVTCLGQVRVSQEGSEPRVIPDDVVLRGDEEAVGVKGAGP